MFINTCDILLLYLLQHEMKQNVEMIKSHFIVSQYLLIIIKMRTFLTLFIANSITEHVNCKHWDLLFQFKLSFPSYLHFSLILIKIEINEKERKSKTDKNCFFQHKCIWNNVQFKSLF